MKKYFLDLSVKPLDKYVLNMYNKGDRTGFNAQCQRPEGVSKGKARPRI